jgi:hypothetical protein
MTNKARYLITTADERTWKFDRPVIFLVNGVERMNVSMFGKVWMLLLQHLMGLDQASKDSDHIDVQELESKLFPVLCDTLELLKKIFIND